MSVARHARASLPALLVLLGTAAGAFAQAPPSPLSQPHPQAPVLAPPVPLGVQRGTTLELTLTGTNLAEPTGLWTSFPARVTIPTDGNNGKEPTKLRVRLEVPKDAPIGFHAIRLATKGGMSNARLFCVDDLPQVLEVDTNRSLTTPQQLTVPCVVVGRADPEVTDYYRIAVTAGQRLTFEVLGRRLGSPFDPELTLFDAHTGRELPGGHSNDAPGLQTDPRLTYTFKEAGDCVVAVRDVMYRGGPDYWYRLRIGDFPCATTPIPMAARRGTRVAVRFAGSNVDGVAPVEVPVPADPAVDAVAVAPRGPNGLYGWPVTLLASDHDEVVEQEPNDEPAKANRVPVPGGITARFEQKNDVDYFVFAGKKGQRLTVAVQSLELGSPTEVYLAVKDAKWQQLAVSNPMAPPRLDFTPPADGDYYVYVENLLYASGPEESYRVTVTPHEPGFDLALFLDRNAAAAGGSVGIPIILAARRDYTGPIELSVVGPPGITGQGTIPANAPPAPLAPQPAQPAATLLVKVAADVPMGPYNLRIQGKATINGKPVVEYASVQAAVSRDLANLPFPPREMLTPVGFAVTEKPPFGLTAKFDGEVLRGGPAPVTITATRAPGFAEEIALSAAGLPRGAAFVAKNIPKGQNEVKTQVNVPPNARVWSYPVTFVGKAKFQNKEFSVDSAPVPLVVTLPFDLKVEPAAVKVVPGGKVKVNVSAVRKGGYQGPIAVEVRNLPANVTAAKATIPPGKTQVEVEVTAAAGAAPGDKKDVNVLGTATAAANQENASPNFTVSVAKK
jgi:hypothetical protein